MLKGSEAAQGSGRDEGLQRAFHALLQEGHASERACKRLSPLELQEPKPALRVLHCSGPEHPWTAISE